MSSPFHFFSHQPNWLVKLTPTWAMSLSVPSSHCAPSAAQLTVGDMRRIKRIRHFKERIPVWDCSRS
jgi:hypothetical protein